MFWKSKGFARAFGIVCLIAANVPQLAPFSPILIKVGAALGVAGVVNASGSSYLRG